MSARAQRFARPVVDGPAGAGPVQINLTRERRGMLAKVAIARKQLGMDEPMYRSVVLRMTGAESAAVASNAALHRLLVEFARLGFQPSRAERRADKAHVRLIYALWADLAPHLEQPTPDALRSFCRRQTRGRVHPDGVDAPDFLNSRQANRVIEGLKSWLARARANAGGEAA